MNSARHLKKNQNQISGNLEKLSSGYAINRAADDAAGLAISEKMRCTITGLTVGTENAEIGVNLVRTADGALVEVHDILNRMVELATLSANGTYDDELDRHAMQLEIDELVGEVNRIVQGTNFNGIPLFTRDVLVDIIDSFYEKQDVQVGTVETSSSYTTSVYTSILQGGTSIGASKSSSYYKSSTIPVPSEALSVSGDVDFPYVIEMSYCVYDDVKSTENNAIFTDKTVSLTVSQNLDGSISVMGSNGKNYATAGLSTAADAELGLDPWTYMAQDRTGISDLVTSTELSLIMSDLLSASTLEVYAGGSIGVISNSTYYNNNKAEVLARGYTYQNGNFYKNGSYVSATTVIPSQDYYNDYASTGSYDSKYQNNMYFGGSSSCDGRVIGASISVTEGGNQIAYSVSHDGYDRSDWTSSSDMTELSNDAILGVATQPEPSHTQATLKFPFFDSADVGTDDSWMDYIVTISQLTTDSTKNEEDVLEEFHYVILTGGNIGSTLNYDGATVKIIYADASEEGHYAVDELCDTIVADTNSYTATRKLDDDAHDVAIDPNIKDQYTIQVGTFTQKKITYTDTPIYEEQDVLVHIYDERPDPIILQVGDQNIEPDRVYIHIDNMEDDVENLLKADVTHISAASTTISLVKEAINEVSLNRSQLGAYENRLYHTINKNRITTESLQSAESLIRDTDMAKEMMEYTQNNILIQASQSMLAQANQLPQGVLQMLS